MAATKPDHVSTNILNGRFDKVHNYIWQNASPQFRDQVPEYSSKGSLPRIGESLATNFGLWNEWLSGLMNEIGLKIIKSATFYNYFSELQKGEVVFGDIVEEIFVEEAELRDFDVNKGQARELARNPAKVRTAFHLTNFEGQYAISTEWSHVRRAFTSEQGVTDLIDRIIASLSNTFESDDRDLYLYTLERRFLEGGIRQEEVDWDSENLPQSARNLTKRIRSTARKFANMRRDYNTAGVLTTARPEDLYIILDAETEAELDVELLATAFNMDRATIAGRVIVIDDWNSVKEERFQALREATDSMVEFSDSENEYLEAGNIKAVVFDGGLFQVYLKQLNMSQAPVHNTMSINHFLNIFKVYGISPFHNAVAFVENLWDGVPDSVDFTVSEKSVNDNFVTISLDTEANVSYAFSTEVQANIDNGVAVLPQGGVVAPGGSTAVLEVTLNPGADDESTLDSQSVEVDDLEVGSTVNLGGEDDGDGDS